MGTFKEYNRLSGWFWEFTSSTHDHEALTLCSDEPRPRKPRVKAIRRDGPLPHLFWINFAPWRIVLGISEVRKQALCIRIGLVELLRTLRTFRTPPLIMTFILSTGTPVT